MSDLTGRVGIVTGASSGIGFQIANTMAESGAKVYSISRTGAPKKGYGESVPGVIHIKGDICNVKDTQKMIQKIADDHDGVIDFLVNNAGTSFKCRAESFPEEQFDHVMEINVKSVFIMSQLCYPFLKKAPGRGRIVNITSMSAHLGFSEVVPYCASKGAVLSMTRGLAVEWASDNININSIAPGWFKSNLLKQVLDPEREKKILNRMPFHAYGDTKDLGAMAAYLCGNDTEYITGQDFAVDGGALAFGY